MHEMQRFTVRKRGRTGMRGRCIWRAAATVALSAGMAGPALAGGTPENVLLIIDPTSSESMYLGNHYKNARNIPDTNVLYMDPGASNFAAFAGPNGNIDAVFGHLANRGLEETIHYIVIAPVPTFFVSAEGLVSDGCWPVRRFSVASAYTLAFLRDMVLAGNVPSNHWNGYATPNPNLPRAFDSNTSWWNGSSHAQGHRYYIAALLGYTGERGNTVAEIRDLIDRSVAADGTHPSGTFYFMNTTDNARNVRHTQFSLAVNSLTSHGGVGEVLNGSLPTGRHDALGVLTGVATPNIDSADMTILPGAFADHLTSFAATFDNSSQTKLSAWIRRGASASSGAVEEPCNYTGKFPHASIHYLIYRGLSMGEAWLRSLEFLPFQQLLVGDPMTRAFAYLPDVQANLPGGTVSGQVSFTPAALVTAPNAAIASLDLFISGERVQTRLPGQAFTIDTAALPDGYHDVRIVAYDDTLMKNAGVDGGLLHVSNHGRTAALSTSITAGNLTTLFSFGASAGGGTVEELRLLHNGRVVAASDSAAATLEVFGRNLGAGISRVQLEAVFADGRRALSEPVELDIEFTSGTPFGQAAVAYSYSKMVLPGSPFVVELPASFDVELSEATFELVTLPAQAIVGPAVSGPYRVMTSPPSASGADEFTFRVTTPAGQSNIATVTLIHGSDVPCYADCDGNGALNIDDFLCFINAFSEAQSLPHEQQVGHYANCDHSTSAPVLTIDDFLCFINEFSAGCE